MTSRVVGGLFALGLTGLLGLVASAPAPAGACSIADPCDTDHQTIDAVDPVFESPGAALEQAATLTVVFDGYGQPRSLLLGDREFAFGEAE